MRRRTVIGPGAAVVLTLDTTAPTVMWGAVGGATAGELLQLEYVTDEAIATADVVLRDGRAVPFSVGETVLEALLPADTPEGAATVRVRDDVGNERSYVGLLTLVGVPYVPPEPPAPQRRPSGPSRQRRQSLLLRSRSRCSVASTATVSRRRRAPASACVRSSSALRAQVEARSAASAVARSILRTRRGDGSRGALATRSTLTRRGPEPPPEALIALDLL